jgi:hypothetical protein
VRAGGGGEPFAWSLGGACSEALKPFPTEATTGSSRGA